MLLLANRGALVVLLFPFSDPKLNFRASFFEIDREGYQRGSAFFGFVARFCRTFLLLDWCGSSSSPKGVGDVEVES